MHTLTPHQVAARSRLATIMLFPTLAGTLVMWWLEILPQERPHLVMMVYLLQLALLVVSTMAYLVARCAMSTSMAFGAGYRAALAEPDHEPQPGLQLVQ